MSRAETSWLKYATHVRDIGAQLNPKWSSPNWEERMEREDRKQLELMRRPLPDKVTDREFFGTRFHDDAVVSTIREGSDFTLTIASWQADNFVLAMESLAGVQRKNDPIRVQLKCHQIVFMRTARAHPNGGLVWAPLEHRPFSEWRFADTILSDWFFEEHARLQWILTLDVHIPTSSLLDSRLFIMIDCESVSAVDLRRADIEKHYGARCARVWDKVCDDADAMNSWDGMERAVRRISGK